MVAAIGFKPMILEPKSRALGQTRRYGYIVGVEGITPTRATRAPVLQTGRPILTVYTPIVPTEVLETPHRSPQLRALTS